MKSEITYWYHPESDSFWIHNPSVDGPIDSNVGDGLSVQLESEYDYITRYVDKIAADPNHPLPEGVTALIRRAYQWTGGGISGEIFYDKHNRFGDGHVINLSKIEEVLPGGIYKTRNNTYMVEMIDPKAPSNRKIVSEFTNG